MILERLPHQIESCRAAADDANMFHCPNQDCTQCGKPFQRRFTANSINGMRGGRIKFLMFSHTTDRITRLLFCLRQFNFNVMERSGLACNALAGSNTLYGVHRPVCFLEA